MSIDTIWQTSTTSSEKTEYLAEQIGQRLKGSEVIEITSDLGGGKTTFTRGLVRGAGSTSHVSSPTYKISNVYTAPKFDIMHYDFYRLSEAGLMRHELAEVLEDPHTVVVVEWSDVLQDVLPKERLAISIKSINVNTRTIEIRFPKSMSYLIDGVQK